MNLKKMTLKINGADRMFICDPEKDSLADVIRRLGLTGTKGLKNGISSLNYSALKIFFHANFLYLPAVYCLNCYY